MIQTGECFLLLHLSFHPAAPEHTMDPKLPHPNSLTGLHNRSVAERRLPVILDLFYLIRRQKKVPHLSNDFH